MILFMRWVLGPLMFGALAYAAILLALNIWDDFRRGGS